jgi:palmitoyltransferase
VLTGEIDKKLLVTCLQHTHNWTMGNDRFKMAFWFDVLFDEELKNDPIHELPSDGLNVAKVHEEVKNWLRRHNKKDKLAAQLLDKYTVDVPSGQTPGPLPKSEDMEPGNIEESTVPVWKPDLEDKFEQDRLYARVSHEIDIWWKKVRDENFDGWVVTMDTVEDAQKRAEDCKQNAMHRYMPQGQDRGSHFEQEEQYDRASTGPEEVDDRSIHGDDGEDDGEEEDEEDEDDSYVEGPLRGLLTEIPNILDTKQIEALHMTVKACIVDSMGSGLTPAGENLQKTRCKMFLALDCGKNLLRELLVFIAVWEQTDQQFIFQITAQIIESFHHNALLPYAWNSLRILKDIVSPAQTVLLRLINYMFRARKDSPIYDDVKDYNRDAKLIHFLYKYFRTRVVPDCIALIYAQAQIRQQKKHPGDFPVDLWDMERAKDGLSQYLDFISVIAEIPEMRHLLIEWDTVYELVALLKQLEAGVARKTLDEVRAQPGPARQPAPAASGSSVPGAERPHDDQSRPQIPVSAVPQSQTGAPQFHDNPHKFPWAGIKIQILIILTSLIAPTNPRRNGPGNPIVQKQLLTHEGIMPLLNCCVYDGHNEYLKERATLAIKFLMEGCEDAQKFVKELVPVKQAQVQAQAAARAQAEAQARQVQNSRGPPPVLSGGGGKGSLESEARELARKKQLMLAGREMLVEGKNMIEEAKQMLRAQGHVVEGDEVPVLPPLASSSGSGGKKAGK